MKRIIRAYALFTIAILFSSCLFERTEYDGTVKVRPGDSIPQFSVVDNKDNIINEQNFNHGEGLIIMFSLDCKFCLSELTRINEYLISHPEIQAIAIGRGYNTAMIEAHWQNEKLSIPYAEDPKRQAYEAFATQGVPILFFTENGIIKSIKATIR